MKTLPEGYLVADNHNHVTEKAIKADAKELKDFKKAEDHAEDHKIVKDTALVWVI